MLEHVPGWLGRALVGMRAGADKLVIAGVALGEGASIDLSSPAFANGARLPPRFTADGDGVSPPLTWGDPPAGAATMALIVEDADAPAVSGDAGSSRKLPWPGSIRPARARRAVLPRL